MNQGTSLRRYLLTRLALVVPMVLILLTFVFLLMRVAPGDPISAALGGHVPQAVIEQIKHELGFDGPHLRSSTPSYLGTSRAATSGRRSPTSGRSRDIILVNGAATLELTFFAMIVAIVVGVSVGVLAGRFRDTSLDVGGRLFGIIIYAMPVFFLGPDGAALLRLLPRLAAGLGSRQPDHPGHARDPHQHLHDRRDHRPQLGRAQGRDPAPDPARGHARPRHGGRVHPADQGERDPHDEGRLHRGSAGARDRGALRRLPPRLPERARAGDHRRRPDARRSCSAAPC